MANYTIVLTLITISLVSGCTTIAPQYQPDFELVNELKDMNVPSMQSGEFAETDESLNRITIRGGAMVSPYGKSYAEYLKKALEEELKQSDLWDPTSKIVISGTLLKNDLDGSGTNTGVSDISAIFVVTKDDSEIYNKTHTIHHQWESSFIGAIAVPKAQQNYAISIQKLLRDFFLDKELLIALKK